MAAKLKSQIKYSYGKNTLKLVLSWSLDKAKKDGKKMYVDIKFSVYDAFL